MTNYYYIYSGKYYQNVFKYCKKKKYINAQMCFIRHYQAHRSIYLITKTKGMNTEYVVKFINF